MRTRKHRKPARSKTRLLLPLALPLVVLASCVGEHLFVPPAGSVADLPPSTSESTEAPPAPAVITVHAVEDGRTVLLSDGSRLRVANLAAPGLCYATAAAAFARTLLQGKPVYVEQAVRGVAPLMLADGTDYALLAVGMGILRGDANRDPAFEEAQASAKRAELGLWGAPCKGADVLLPSASGQSVTAAPSAAPSAAPASPPPSLGPATSRTVPPIVMTTISCTSGHRIVAQRADGFEAEVTVRNAGSAPLNGWRLRWLVPNGLTVTRMSNAEMSQAGAQVTATNPTGSPVLPRDGSVSVRFAVSGPVQSPVVLKMFSLNGKTCSTR